MADRIDSSGRLMREGLTHPRPGFKDEDFFRLIDSTGGWPIGYRYVGFEHTDERTAGYTNSPRNTGWWTVIADADDYYLWKLSPECLQRIADAVLSAIYLPKVNASKLRIRNSRQYVACLAKHREAPNAQG